MSEASTAEKPHCNGTCGLCDERAATDEAVLAIVREFYQQRTGEPDDDERLYQSAHDALERAFDVELDRREMFEHVIGVARDYGGSR